MSCMWEKTDASTERTSELTQTTKAEIQTPDLFAETLAAKPSGCIESSDLFHILSCSHRIHHNDSVSRNFCTFIEIQEIFCI